MYSRDEMFLDKFNAIEVFNQDVAVEDFGSLQHIGEGAFGKVFKAMLVKETKIDIPDLVAIKVMVKSDIIKKNAMEMVVHEVKLLALLSNTFIINFYASFSNADNIYIVLELMPFDLFSILRSKVYFGEPTSRFFGSQVLLGLEYLHEFDIAYRDLKPENILVGRNAGIKITDMTFSKYIPGRSYTCNGTAEYMAPEVVLGHGHGIGVDWWSFGVLLYELCAGHSPFSDKYTLKMLRNITEAKFKFPHHFSEEIKDLVRKLLVVDVTKRLGCMKDKLEDIKMHPWFDGDVDWIRLQTQYLNLPRELSDLNDVIVTSF